MVFAVLERGECEDVLPGAHTHPDSNTHTDRWGNRDSDAHTDPDSNAHTNPGGKRDSDSHADANV
jgi:hypothetical protein